MKTTVKYDIEVIQDEARKLIAQGLLNRHQPIYALCKYIPPREWEYIRRELEKNEFLLRDRILDLVGNENWQHD